MSPPEIVVGEGWEPLTNIERLNFKGSLLKRIQIKLHIWFVKMRLIRRSQIVLPQESNLSFENIDRIRFDSFEKLPSGILKETN